jgi:hypothetical protein
VEKMTVLEALATVQYVVGQDGQPTAVQMRFETWQMLLDWIEDLEDRKLVKAMLPRLRMGPEKAKTLRWEDIKAEWDEQV